MTQTPADGHGMVDARSSRCDARAAVATPDRDRDNAARFVPGGRGGHAESHFLKANSADGERALWLKLTLLRPRGLPDEALCEVWAIAFRRGGGHVAVKSTFPMASARLGGAGRFHLEYGDPGTLGAELSQGWTRGRAATLEHAIAWDLSLEGSEPSLHLYPVDAMYRARFPKQKQLSPWPDARFAGWLEVDGERWLVDGWRGMQGHNWGPEHTPRYAWAHCNTFRSRDEAHGSTREGTFVEVGVGRVRIGPWLAPWLGFVQVGDRGERNGFGAARIHVQDGTGGSGRYQCRIEARHGRLHMVLALEARPVDLVGLRYQNPAGPTTYCLNSKIARCELRLARGADVIADLVSDSAAFELGTTDPTHGIELLV